MNDKKRMDAPDTVDLALHWLAKLQSEGWGVERVETDIDYGRASKHGIKLPISAMLTIRLSPSR